jgi:hypothetical protein
VRGETMVRPERFPEVHASTLREWAALFGRQTSPRIIVVALAAAVVGRVLAGGYHPADLLVVVVLVAIQPFTEWLLHVFLLHFRPRAVRGRTIDLYVSRKHRAHHRDPLHIGLVFVALPALIGLIVVFGLITALVLRNLELWLTAQVTGMSLLLLYEWTHYLIHTAYAPRTRLYRYVWRAHRLHHYKNEHYWFGITNHLADHVLRTFPDKAGVPTSPTARNLHGELTLGVG